MEILHLFFWPLTGLGSLSFAAAYAEYTKGDKGGIAFYTFIGLFLLYFAFKLPI